MSRKQIVLLSLALIFSFSSRYVHRKLNSTICLTGKFKFLDFNYQDDPAKNDELHYYNVYRTNRYFGFYQISKDERTSERELMMRGKNAGTRFDFVCHAGQSRHYAPHHHGFFYKRKSQGYFPDEIYGSGMITVWREAHKAYPKQTYVGFEDI